MRREDPSRKSPNLPRNQIPPTHENSDHSSRGWQNEEPRVKRKASIWPDNLNPNPTTESTLPGPKTRTFLQGSAKPGNQVLQHGKQADGQPQPDNRIKSPWSLPPTSTHCRAPFQRIRLGCKPSFIRPTPPRPYRPSPMLRGRAS